MFTKIFFLVLFTLLCENCANPTGSPDLVDHGSMTPIESNININEAPYQVSLHFNGISFCGGVIYDSLTVITAANCLEGIDSIKSGEKDLHIRAGSASLNEGGVLIEVAVYERHPHHLSSRSFQNDIAILRLFESLTFNDYIKPIPLIEQNSNFSSTSNMAVVTGWSMREQENAIPTNSLKRVSVGILDQDVCKDLYRSFDIDVTETMLCADLVEGGNYICKGDSGTPLVLDGKLAGITVGGSCGKTSTPGIFANISTLRNWIVDDVAWFNTIESRSTLTLRKVVENSTSVVIETVYAVNVDGKTHFSTRVKFDDKSE